MTQGFITIHRDIMNWRWYKNENMKNVFIHLLLNANFTQKEWEEHIIKRGSFITSVKKLSFEIGIPPQKIRLALKKLEKTNEISIKTTNKFTIVTVCNYDTYQSVNQGGEQTKNKQRTIKRQTGNKEKTNQQQTKNNQTTTTNNDKKVNNYNNEKKGEKKYFKIDEYISEKLKLKIFEFIEYREDINKPYKSQKSIDALVNRLKNIDEKTSIKQIEQSIENGWQGIFELKQGLTKKSNIREMYKPIVPNKSIKERLTL